MAKQGGKSVTKEPVAEKKSANRKAIQIDGKDYYLQINNYEHGKLAMSLDLVDEHGAQAHTLSKCFGNFYRDETFVPNCSTFIDTNNCSRDVLQPVFEALDARPRTVFGSPYTIQSGFCEYPIYDFNPEKLKEYDPEGFAAYQKSYSENFSIEQRNLQIAMFGGDFTDDFDDQLS